MSSTQSRQQSKQSPDGPFREADSYLRAEELQAAFDLYKRGFKSLKQQLKNDPVEYDNKFINKGFQILSHAQKVLDQQRPDVAREIVIQLNNLCGPTGPAEYPSLTFAILNTLSVSERQMGKYSSALEFLTSSLDIAKDNNLYAGETLVNMSAILMDVRQFQKAKQTVHQAIKEIGAHMMTNPSKQSSKLAAIAYYNGGKCEEALGDPQEAIDNYKSGMQVLKRATISPEDKVYRKVSMAYMHVMKAFKHGDPPKALKPQSHMGSRIGHNDNDGNVSEFKMSRPTSSYKIRHTDSAARPQSSKPYENRRPASGIPMLPTPTNASKGHFWLGKSGNQSQVSVRSRQPSSTPQGVEASQGPGEKKPIYRIKGKGEGSRSRPVSAVRPPPEESWDDGAEPDVNIGEGNADYEDRGAKDSQTARNNRAKLTIELRELNWRLQKPTDDVSQGEVESQISGSDFRRSTNQKQIEKKKTGGMETEKKNDKPQDRFNKEMQAKSEDGLGRRKTIQKEDVADKRVDSNRNGSKLNTATKNIQEPVQSRPAQIKQLDSREPVSDKKREAKGGQGVAQVAKSREQCAVDIQRNWRKHRVSDEYFKKYVKSRYPSSRYMCTQYWRVAVGDREGGDIPGQTAVPCKVLIFLSKDRYVVCAVTLSNQQASMVEVSRGVNILGEHSGMRVDRQSGEVYWQRQTNGSAEGGRRYSLERLKEEIMRSIIEERVENRGRSESRDRLIREREEKEKELEGLRQQIILDREREEKKRMEREEKERERLEQIRMEREEKERERIEKEIIKTKEAEQRLKEENEKMKREIEEMNKRINTIESKSEAKKESKPADEKNQGVSAGGLVGKSLLSKMGEIEGKKSTPKQEKREEPKEETRSESRQDSKPTGKQEIKPVLTGMGKLMEGIREDTLERSEEDKVKEDKRKRDEEDKRKRENEEKRLDKMVEEQLMGEIANIEYERMVNGAINTVKEDELKKMQDQIEIEKEKVKKEKEILEQKQKEVEKARLEEEERKRKEDEQKRIALENEKRKNDEAEKKRLEDEAKRLQQIENDKQKEKLRKEKEEEENRKKEEELKKKQEMEEVRNKKDTNLKAIKLETEGTLENQAAEEWERIKGDVLQQKVDTTENSELQSNQKASPKIVVSKAPDVESPRPASRVNDSLLGVDQGEEDFDGEDFEAVEESREEGGDNKEQGELDEPAVQAPSEYRFDFRGNTNQKCIVEVGRLENGKYQVQYRDAKGQLLGVEETTMDREGVARCLRWSRDQPCPTLAQIYSSDQLEDPLRELEEQGVF